MSNYAVISGGVVQNIYVANAPLNGADVLTTTAGPGWTYSGGIFTAPSAGSAPILPLIVQAIAALNYANQVAIQCFKSSVAYPSAWQTYDTALQNILNGTTTTGSVPSVPTMPSGLPSSFPTPSQAGSLA